MSNERGNALSLFNKKIEPTAKRFADKISLSHRADVDSKYRSSLSTTGSNSSTNAVRDDTTSIPKKNIGSPRGQKRLEPFYEGSAHR